MTLDDLDALILAWRHAVVDGSAAQDGWPEWINIRCKVGQELATQLIRQTAHWLRRSVPVLWIRRHRALVCGHGRSADTGSRCRCTAAPCARSVPIGLVWGARAVRSCSLLALTSTGASSPANASPRLEPTMRWAPHDPNAAAQHHWLKSRDEFSSRPVFQHCNQPNTHRRRSS